MYSIEFLSALNAFDKISSLCRKIYTCQWLNFSTHMCMHNMRPKWYRLSFDPQIQICHATHTLSKMDKKKAKKQCLD